MKVDEQKAKNALDKIEMSQEKREAIKQNKGSFIKQANNMRKVFVKSCNKCRAKLIGNVQNGAMNKMTSQEMLDLFCSRCKSKMEKYFK